MVNETYIPKPEGPLASFCKPLGIAAILSPIVIVRLDIRSSWPNGPFDVLFILGAFSGNSL